MSTTRASRTRRSPQTPTPDDASIEETDIGDTNVPDTTVADTTVADTDVPEMLAETAVADTTVVDTSDGAIADATDDTLAVDSSADTADSAAPADSADVAVADASDASTTSMGLIWYFGDYSTDNSDSVGNFNIVTSGGVSLGLSRGFLVKADVDGFDVSPTHIVVTADTEVADRHDLSIIDRATSVRTVLVKPPGTQDVTNVQFSPDHTMIAFTSDLAAAGQRDIYVLPIAGGTPKRVSPTRPAGGTPTSLQPVYFEWSRDSKYLAIVGDLEVSGVEQLYVTDVTAATPTPVTALSAAAAGATSANGVQSRPTWTASGKILFRGFLASDTYRGLYQVDVDGTNLKRVVNSPTTANVGTFGVSPDGMKVAFAADRMVATAYEVYVMPLDGSASATRITDGTVMAGRNPSLNQLLQWSPSATHIAFVSDYVHDEKDEVIVVPASGGGQKRVALIGGGVNQEARMVAWSPDSTQLAFIADHRVLGTIEAFRIANITTVDQTPILVHDATLNGDMSFITWLP